MFFPCHQDVRAKFAGQVGARSVAVTDLVRCLFRGLSMQRMGFETCIALASDLSSSSVSDRHSSVTRYRLPYSSHISRAFEELVCTFAMCCNAAL